jgi:hypothetical protein
VLDDAPTPAAQQRPAPSAGDRYDGTFTYLELRSAYRPQTLETWRQSGIDNGLCRLVPIGLPAGLANTLADGIVADAALASRSFGGHVSISILVVCVYACNAEVHTSSPYLRWVPRTALPSAV